MENGNQVSLNPTDRASDHKAMCEVSSRVWIQRATWLTLPCYLTIDDIENVGPNLQLKIRTIGVESRLDTFMVPLASSIEAVHWLAAPSCEAAEAAVAGVERVDVPSASGT